MVGNVDGSQQSGSGFAGAYFAFFFDGSGNAVVDLGSGTIVAEVCFRQPSDGPCRPARALVLRGGSFFLTAGVVVQMQALGSVSFKVEGCTDEAACRVVSETVN